VSAPTYAPRPKESGHWYDPRTRQLVETVPYSKKGTSGPPDLRHARKLGLVPGVTTITSCAAAWGLEKWKREQVLMAALTLPRAEGETDAAFIARVTEDSEQQAASARDAGTAIHAAIQQFYTDREWPDDPTMAAHVRGAVEAIDNTFGSGIWIPEFCVSHPAGYATKIDLHRLDLYRPGVILDFKSKDFGPGDTARLEAYDEHAMQLAAGTVAAGMESPRAAIIYVSRSHPGLSWPVGVSTDELTRGWEMFQALLAYWKLKNRYDSSWE
jgi:hypothetical protein